MTLIELNDSLLATLKGKVVVITGGSNGIGKSAVHQFYEQGAKIVFGDVSIEQGAELESKLNSPDVCFVQCNVSSYPDQLALFATAKSRFGHVDIVIANAGITLTKDIFAPEADIEHEPSMKELDVNLKGVLFTARIGMAYLRENGGGDLILVSSIAGFKESPALTPYLASKHGVIGILRGLRLTAIKENIRVNTVCPWMTKTVMVKGIQKGWNDLKLPTNEVSDVVNSFLICATANRGSQESSYPGTKIPFSGNILYVAGGKSYEIESKLQELEPEWLGPENSMALRKGQAFLQDPATSWAG